MSTSKRGRTSSSSAAAIGASSPLPDSDPDLSGDRGEANPSTSVTSAAGCGRHVLRAPKDGRRARFLPYPKVTPRRSSSSSTSRSGGEGGILSIGAPPREEASDADDVRKMEFGSLFHGCSSCRRRITDRDAVFMYGVLHAFCSVECRDKKMELDGNPSE